MKNWFILHVIDGTETKVAGIIKNKLNASEYVPFLPSKEIIFRRAGISKIEKKLIFPGYVFVKTNREADRILDELRWLLFSIKQVNSVLHYGGDKKDVAIRDDEVSVLERLFDKDHCITGSTGVIENGGLRILSGPLAGLEESVRKINRNRHEAVIELALMDKTMRISLLLNITSKT